MKNPPETLLYVHSDNVNNNNTSNDENLNRM